MRISLCFLMFLTLGGCAQYQAERQQAQLGADNAKCESFGAVRGSAAYVQCMVDMDNQREANSRARRAGIRQALDGFQPTLPGYQVTPIPNPLANQPARNTTCNTYGSTTNCTTY